jgi:hypothetical protein
VSAPTTLDALTREVAKMLAQVQLALGGAQQAEQTLNALGWAAPPGVDLLSAFGVDVTEFLEKLGAVLGSTSEEQQDTLLMVRRYADLALAVADLLQEIDRVATELPAALTQLPDYVSKTRIDKELPERLLAFLVVGYVAAAAPPLFALLQLLGVVRLQPFPEDPAVYQVRHVRAIIELDRLATLFGDPAELFRTRYGWGSADLEADTLLTNLGALFQSLGARPQMRRLPQRVEERLTGAPVPEAATDPLPQLVISVLRGLGGDPLDVGVSAYALRARTDQLPGLGVSPFAAGTVATEFPLGDRLSLYVESYARLEGGVAILVRPEAPVKIETDLIGDGSAGTLASGSIGAGLRLAAEVDEPMRLLEVVGGTKLQARELRFGGGAHIDADGSADAFVEAAIQGGEIVITLAEADGFLAAVLGEGVRVGLDLEAEWSREHGLHIRGAGALEAVFPVHLALGPLLLQTVHVALEAGELLQLEASATLDLRLGPVNAAVERLGMQAQLTLEEGNLSIADLHAAFKPPSGAGLSIDAGALTGGGFLFFDPKNEQYAGGMHLEFEGGLTLNAIGLLTTRMPDGSRGFSLLVIVQASGFAPVQLGFGFTLNGVGGLLAINRTVAVEVLRAGVRNKTLDTILRSQDDPTPRAPQIVSTLQTVFPPAPNQYIFGPMALIGWGTPTLITIELALILELPTPLRLIVLGRMRAALPDPERAIVNINLDVLGVIDFDRGELAVDATLYDSRVGPFALTGDMAARASWGLTPDFAMALGGFHPAYKPPPGFPELRRLALALSTGSNPRVRMEAYFALTSNTVQVGARLELYVEAAGFGLEGGLGFDTLIQFSPFRLLAEIYARLALKRGSTTLMGLDIHVHLIGPAPWVLWGEASFKLLFISISIPFRATIGRAEETPEIEREEVWAKLYAELIAPTSWTAQLPPDSGRLVVLRGDTIDGEVLAHPLGSLTVSQRVVPLERTLDLFGAVPPKDFDRFEIIGAGGLILGDDTSDYFAPAQFRRMSDAEKLSSPSFERMVSGVHLNPSEAVRVGYVQETPLDYEQSVILDIDQPAPDQLDERYQPDGDAVAALAEHGPAGTAELRDQGRAKFAPGERGPVVAEPEYVVATKDGLEPKDLDGLDGTYTGARERLRGHPNRDELQVVRMEEVVFA